MNAIKMKKVIYDTLQHGRVEVEYDEEAPCRVCGFSVMEASVMEASVGGTDVCPWCDCGFARDGMRKPP